MDSAAPSPCQTAAGGDFVSRPIAADDLDALTTLHDIAFGPGALTRAAYRVREGQPPFTPYCRVLYRGGELIAAVRYTEVLIGGEPGALMLGPLAVSPAHANHGHGRRLLAESLDAADRAGVALVLLVGDPPYYERFGFVVVPRGQITMPGPVDPARLLARGKDGTQPGLRFKGRVEGAA